MTVVAQVPYVRPRMYPAQEAAIFHGERFGIVEASTKAGKTVACIVWLHERAALEGGPGRNYWWVAPTIDQAKIAFRRLKLFLPDGSFQANNTERSITLRNGSVLWFKSGEQPDNLFGEDVYGVVIDEASRCRAEVWMAVRSTLTATGGMCRIIGNVRGSRNWAWARARAAERGLPGWRYAKLTAWDAVEGGVFSREEVEDARRTLTDAEFRELYLAEAVDSSGPFFDVSEVRLVADWPRHAKVARAWDFAITPMSAAKAFDADWTAGVKVAWDGETAYVVDVVRARLSPDQAVDRWVETATLDGRTCEQVIEEERGSSGAMVVSQFTREARNWPEIGRVVGAKLTGDKEARAFWMAQAANRGGLVLVEGPWNRDFLAELESFPDPARHDDQVDAAAHAFNRLARKGKPKASSWSPVGHQSR